MNAVVVLQARTGSSRLPAKVLLPLGGLPLVVLAARRAGNTGLRVIVATSDSPDDDALASLLAEHGVECFRGSLDDVLGRFVTALEGLGDDTAVVRLTADNPLPDGSLIDELLEDFQARGLQYLACNGAPCGVPYGLSAEVVELGWLREADRDADSASDREHVTPYIVRKCGTQWFMKHHGLGKGHFRCTVDDYDDYQGMLHVFAGESDPIHVPAMQLVSRLGALPFQPRGNAPANRLIVGGAQLGRPYGIANRTGAPEPQLVGRILKSAIANGVEWIDTAHAYTGSEAQIGQALNGSWVGRVRIVTKLSPMSELHDPGERASVRATVDASVFQSCMRLRRTSLDAVLLHRAAHLDAWGGAVWQRLRDHRRDGTITTIGVSVQTPAELERALQEDDLGLIQMPMNILDWRWDAAVEVLLQARRSRSIAVHIRSSLLQGLVTSWDPEHWRRANESDPGRILDWLSRLVREMDRIDVVDLCLAYARSQPWADGVVVGMETLEQLHDNIRYFLAPSLTPDELERIRRGRPEVSDATLDPAKWSTE